MLSIIQSVGLCAHGLHVTVEFLQLNIFVLAFARDGQMLSLAEMIILVLVVVLVILIIIVGNVAVSRHLLSVPTCTVESRQYAPSRA